MKVRLESRKFALQKLEFSAFINKIGCVLKNAEIP